VASGIQIPIFDGHNDALLRVRTDGLPFLDRNDGPESGCVFDLPRVQKGGLAAGIFAEYIRPDGFKAKRPSGIEASRLVLASFSGGAKDPLSFALVPLTQTQFSRGTQRIELIQIRPGHLAITVFQVMNELDELARQRHG
jgi:hypothetical protein